MAKLSISRILETSRLLETAAGQELSELITYVAELAEQSLRALRQGLTFTDNFNAEIRTVSLTQSVDQIVSLPKPNPIGVIPLRMISRTGRIDSFGWHISDEGELVVNATFSPSEASPQQVVILAVYG